MTTDGRANERLAASQLVGEGNNHHCDAHNIQLDIEDVTGKNGPPNCADHRAVIRKAHDLVILINGHKVLFTEFSRLTQLKRANEDNERKFDALIINNETRWDSELAMLERLVAFDAEILELYQNLDLGIADDCILTRFEFDLAYAMTRVLGPFRLFTKFVQKREEVTLAHVPHLIDELVTKLAPHSFDNELRSRADGVVAAMNIFQSELVISIKRRYGPMFNSGSLARCASFFIPGRRYRDFVNFPTPDEDEVVTRVKERIVTEAIGLLPPDADDEKKRRTERNVRSALEDLRADLNKLDPNLPENDPLRWIPLKSDAPILFPAAQMFLAIFSSSAEDERNFSSAGITLNKLRSRMAIENFRYEHRIRRYLTAGSDILTQAGRQARQERAEEQLCLFTARYAALPLVNQPVPLAGNQAAVNARR